MSATNTLSLVLKSMPSCVRVLVTIVALSLCSCDGEDAAAADGDGGASQSQAGGGAGAAGRGGAGDPGDPGDVRIEPTQDAGDSGQSSEPVQDAGDADANDSGQLEPRTTTELCSARIPYTGPARIDQYTWEGSGIASDRDGNLYVVGLVEGSVDVRGPSSTTLSIHGSVVLKYDSACQLVWGKAFGGADALFTLVVIAAGTDGELAVGGMLHGGHVDFGAGPLDAAFVPLGVLMKLSADDGSVLWNKGYGSGLNRVEIQDIGIDDAGDIAFSGIGGEDTSFGAGAIGGVGPSVSYVAKVSSEGDLRYAFAIGDTDIVQTIAVHGSGDVITEGRTSTSRVAIGGESFTLSAPDSTGYIASLDPAGSAAWLHTVSTEHDGVENGWYSGTVAIDRDRNVVFDRQMIERDATGKASSRGVLGKLGSDGVLAWSQPVAPSSTHDFYQGALAVDSAGNILHAYVLDDPATPPSPSPSTWNMGTQVHIEKLAPDGDLAWHHVQGEGEQILVWGIAAGRDDAVWVVRAEHFTSETAPYGALVITKLAP